MKGQTAMLMDTMPAPFPVVATVNSGSDPGGATSQTVQLPANIAAGDLLLIFAAFAATVTAVAVAGWTATGVGRHWVLYKFATGSEGATAAMTWTTSTQSRARSMRITGAHASSVPETNTTGATSAGAGAVTLTPSWGIANTLWICSVGFGTGTQTVNTFNDTGDQYSTTDLGICSRKAFAASASGMGFGLSASTPWQCQATAIRPKW